MVEIANCMYTITGARKGAKKSLFLASGCCCLILSIQNKLAESDGLYLLRATTEGKKPRIKILYDASQSFDDFFGLLIALVDLKKKKKLKNL